MQVFKTYIESVKGQTVSQADDILPLFALPYVATPEKHPSFRDLFSVGSSFFRHSTRLLLLLSQQDWLVQLRSRLIQCLDGFTSTQSSPKLVDLVQQGERTADELEHVNNENEALKYRIRETNRQIKHLSNDYCNLISESNMNISDFIRLIALRKASPWN